MNFNAYDFGVKPARNKHTFITFSKKIVSARRIKLSEFFQCEDIIGEIMSNKILRAFLEKVKATSSTIKEGQVAYLLSELHYNIEINFDHIGYSKEVELFEKHKQVVIEQFKLDLINEFELEAMIGAKDIIERAWIEVGNKGFVAVHALTKTWLDFVKPIMAQYEQTISQITDLDKVKQHYFANNS